MDETNIFLYISKMNAFFFLKSARNNVVLHAEMKTEGFQKFPLTTKYLKIEIETM